VFAPNVERFYAHKQLSKEYVRFTFIDKAQKDYLEQEEDDLEHLAE